MKILAMLKGKILITALIVVTSLLAATYIDRGLIANDRDKTKKALISMQVSNERLVAENAKLAEDIKNKPTQSIITTKEVMVEVCHAEVTKQAIKDIPSKRPKEEVSNETHVADIDDRLPSDLLRLLQ